MSSAKACTLGDYIEREHLAEIAGDACDLGAQQSLAEVLNESSDELVPVGETAAPPLDVRTYRARRDRWRSGDGPAAHGTEAFVTFLQECDRPAVPLSVSGSLTTYVIILDTARERVLASVAVDAPRSATDVL